jgi:hypothetical protein
LVRTITPGRPLSASSSVLGCCSSRASEPSTTSGGVTRVGLSGAVTTSSLSGIAASSSPDWASVGDGADAAPITQSGISAARMLSRARPWP